MIATTNTLPNAAATLVVSMHRPTDVNQTPTVRQATEMAHIPTANNTALAADTTAIKVAIMATTAVRLECDMVTGCSQTLRSTASNDHTLNTATISRTTQLTPV
jgi:hypothetical protein